MPRRHLVPKTPLTARNADRYDLYQRAVLVVPKGPFLAQTFERIAGRRGASLREDFCGTALLCAEWVGAKRGRTAVGIDIDPEPLAWGAKHNIQPLGARASLVRLLQQDARDPCRGPFDVSVALNFSYFVFQTREELRRYFAGVQPLDGAGRHFRARCLWWLWRMALSVRASQRRRFHLRVGAGAARPSRRFPDALRERGRVRRQPHWPHPGMEGGELHTGLSGERHPLTTTGNAPWHRGSRTTD